jgi:2-polyprenyl-6-methoxyphenol hydroxylase-like FAD-dependent oxidoreductase
MAEAKRITIVGGGLAGLTLGIALRQREVAVTICEAGHYPRHRVCGEFISGRGQATLARLGMSKLINESGAVSAQTAAFFRQPNPPRRARCRQQPSAFRVSIWTPRWRKISANSAVNCSKANVSPGILAKASSAPRAAGRKWSRAGRAGSA